MTAPASGYLQRSRFKLLCTLALFACLNACGQIGPLFLPESDTSQSNAPKSKTAVTPPANSPSSEEERDTKDKPNGL